MDNRNPPTLYPCLFPMKIIGECSPEFEAEVLSVMQRHVGDLTSESVGRKHSRGGKYLSLTIRFTAQSREHVEQVYAELNARERVLLVL